jgi:hypothetical protein
MVINYIVHTSNNPDAVSTPSHLILENPLWDNKSLGRITLKQAKQKAFSMAGIFRFVRLTQVLRTRGKSVLCIYDGLVSFDPLMRQP